MKVGFIGLGTMGASMASNLQKAGHELWVNDVRREATAPHVAAGAHWRDTPRQVAEAVEVVFTSLPGPPEVEAVAVGADGLIHGMPKGAAYFDLSTNSPALVRRLHAQFRDKGLALLDAPVSGGPKGARTRKLALWVGGDREVYDRFKPVLDAIGDQPYYVGPIGAGSVAKLVHNCAGYAVQTALAEVFTMGVKAGVDPLELWKAVRQGAGGRRRTFDGLVDLGHLDADGGELGGVHRAVGAGRLGRGAHELGLIGEELEVLVGNAGLPDESDDLALREPQVDYVARTALHVRGFISPPVVNRSNRKDITLFVNGRWVQDIRDVTLKSLREQVAVVSQETLAATGVNSIRDVRTSERGTPLVSSMIESARTKTSSPLLAIINADILLMPDTAWQSDPWPTIAQVRAAQGKVAAIWYDLIPLSHPDHFHPELPGPFRAYFERMLGEADLMIAISAAVEREISTVD